MKSTFNQPVTLYSLIAAYMSERYGYYMVRTVLVLYMINMLLQPTTTAYTTFAAFASLMYIAPLIAGKFIDRNFDSDHATFTGGILLATGLLMIGYLNGKFLSLALSLIICGKGFYTPGVITSIGQLYANGDKRRESGFLTMYSAVNISGIAASISAPVIIAYGGWQAAFYAAGGVTLLGTILLTFHRWRCGDFRKIPPQAFLEFCIFIAAGITIITLLMRSALLSDAFMLIVSAVLILYSLFCMIYLDIYQRRQFLTCISFTIFSLISFTLIQQSALSLTVFADTHVNRVLGHYSIPTFYFLALTPLFIIIVTPFLNMLWRTLENADMNPSTGSKFAAGTIFLGVSFILLTIGIEYSHANKIHAYWLVASYFMQTLGELLVFPVGLSMITERAPRHMIGFTIGAWYFMIAVANKLSGVIAGYTVTMPHPVAHHHATEALALYANVFGSLGLFAIASGLVLAFLIQVKNLISQY